MLEYNHNPKLILVTKLLNDYWKTDMRNVIRKLHKIFFLK